MLENLKCFRQEGSEGGWHLGVGGVPLCGVFLSPDELEISPKAPSELELCASCAERHEKLLGGA